MIAYIYDDFGIYCKQNLQTDIRPDPPPSLGSMTNSKHPAGPVALLYKSCYSWVGTGCRSCRKTSLFTGYPVTLS